jgi:hypothetical protein
MLNSNNRVDKSRQSHGEWNMKQVIHHAAQL